MVCLPFFSAVITDCHLPDAVGTVSNTLRPMERQAAAGRCGLCHSMVLPALHSCGGLVPYHWTTIFSYILDDFPNFYLFPTYKFISTFILKSLLLMAGIDLLYLCTSCQKETKPAVYIMFP